MPQKKNKEITIKEFADRMAYDCIFNIYSDVALSTNSYLPTVADIPRNIGTNAVDYGDDVSTVTASTTYASIASEHSFSNNAELEMQSNGKTRPIRRRCRAVGCPKPTGKMCYHPRCRCFQYPSPKGLVRGVFYCTEHFYIHYDAIAAGTGV